MKRTKSRAAIFLGSTLLSVSCAAPAATTSPGAAATSAAEVGVAGSPGKPGGGTGSAYSDKYNFEATTFEGASFELAAHKGTPVVINFWESW